MIRSTICIFALATVSAAGAQESGKTAHSTIIDSKGKTVGKAIFVEKKDGVQVTVKLSGLPPGKHGFHLHENGTCDPPGFAAAGSHFNPFVKHHGAQNPKGKHAGDLPNLVVKADGTAEMTAMAAGSTLRSGQASLLKEGGTALVIHEKPDDEKTDPTGNAGARIACGVVVAK